MRISTGLLVIVLILNFFLPSDLHSQESREIFAVSAEKAPRIDGLLKEAVWQTAGHSGFTQSDPQDGSPSSEKTFIWIAYDKNYLYVAARLFDHQPERIISRLGRRDELVDSDWFTFAIDPYLDRRSGYQFSINPAGSIIDSTLYNDEGQDNTWDGIWESATHVDELGWTVEIKIPYHQLRFKKRDQYIWGVNFIRLIKRKNERAAFSWIPKEESGYVSRFALLKGIHGILPGRLIEFLPYAVARADFSPEVTGNPFEPGYSLQGNAGFDFKSRLQSNVTLNMTINPDFGQVEVDPAVINISDQETYYSEKRPFFVEGADIFRFGEGGANSIRYLGWSNPRFFYSRRIGRTPQGSVTANGFSDYPEWTTILAAAKLTGKIGTGWNIGFLSALTEREYADVSFKNSQWEEEVEPFAFYGIIRAQKEFNQGNQGLGIISTMVLRDLRTTNLLHLIPKNAFNAALDGWTFLDKNKTWVLSCWLGGTLVYGDQESITRLQRSSLHYFQRPDVKYVSVDMNATTLSGYAGRIFLNKQKGNFILNAAAGAISPGFNSMDAGYHSRGDTINMHIETGYQTFHPGKLFRKWSLIFSTYRNYDFSGNKTHEYYYFTASGQFLNYWATALTLSHDPERYNHYLTRGGPMALYPAGTSRILSISSDNRKPMVLSLYGHYRTHPNGTYNWTVSTNLRWKPSSNFSLSIGPSYTYRHSEGQYITSIKDELKSETYGTRYIFSDIIQQTLPIEIRINWTFTPRLSLQVYLQPFIGVGDYFFFKELTRARTFDFTIFGEGASTIAFKNHKYTVDPDGEGPARPFSFANPDFNLKSLRGTIVFRWEYRPGSALYLVWTQRRADYQNPGDFSFARDFMDIFQASGDHIFLLKFIYRFNI